MKYELSIFKHEDFGEIRTVNINGETYFVGKDIAIALGYEKPQNAIAAHVDDEDKTTALIQGTGSNYKSNAVLINEPGIYSLIFGSKLKKAKEFKRWVRSEVLPSIRKTGSYSVNQTKDVQSSYRNYYDVIAAVTSSVTVTEIAQDYDIQASTLNSLLADFGIQYKENGVWILADEYQGLGYTIAGQCKATTSTGEVVYVTYTRWTRYGLKFIYEFLRDKGILPRIEQKHRREIEGST